jgi:hypothetical protein
MEILGHTTIQQTMDRYGHVQPERLRAAADAMWTRHSVADFGCTTRTTPPMKGGDGGRAAGQAPC